MKVALCFIISYHHVLNKENIWIKWIKSNQDIINVYFHYKDINMISSPWVKMYTIPPEFIQKTSYYNVVPAYMSLLSYAFHHDSENTWFSMVTDSCVPIISPAKFRQLFFDHYYSSIFKWKPAYWNINIHRRANLRLFKNEYWLANDAWFTLSRSHVQKCILFMAAKNNIYKQVNEGGLANESIFAIMLQTFKELTNSKTLLNEVSTITDWTRMSSPTSPHLFKDATPDNINIIKNLLKENKYTMFLRKVDRSFPDQVIYDLMETDFGHKYEPLYNIKESKKKAYKFYYNSCYCVLTLVLGYCIWIMMS
jgi:Core-2/I-Branching enzyme